MKYCLSNDTWGKEEIEAAKRVIDAKKVTLGENVMQYEKKFASKMNAKFAVMSNSGSSANLLAISALVLSGKLKKGDEILVTAVSWSTTYFPLIQCGLSVRFVDIDIATLNINLDLLEMAITPKSKAVLAVNLLGNPNDFNRLLSICNDNDLILLEDNCESMGAEYENKKAGTFGVLGSYSSYYSHHICTMEGGITVTDDEELYHYMLSIRSHGWTRHLPQNSNIYTKKTDSFYESFNFILPGYNLRPLEIEAAIGLIQLEKLDSFVQQRRKNADYFLNQINMIPDIQVQQECGKSSWFGFAIILMGKKAGRRNEFIDMFNQFEIEVRPIVAGNFTRQRALKYMEYSIYETLEYADYIHENGFFVGNHSIQMEENIDLLINAMKKVN